MTKDAPRMYLAKRSLIALLVFGLPTFAASAPGITNFDEVDAHVLRGGQPTNEGFRYLAKRGVKIVIDLREAGGRADAEKRIVTAAGMQYVNVPMTGHTPPTDEEIGKILALLENGTAGPVFVHCMRGADRTGTVIAAYHIDHDKWDNAHALQDAKDHHMGFLQVPRQSYIRNFKPRTQVAAAATTAVQ